MGLSFRTLVAGYSVLESWRVVYTGKGFETYTLSSVFCNEVFGVLKCPKFRYRSPKWSSCFKRRKEWGTHVFFKKVFSVVRYPLGNFKNVKKQQQQQQNEDTQIKCTNVISAVSERNNRQIYLIFSGNRPKEVRKLPFVFTNPSRLSTHVT